MSEEDQKLSLKNLPKLKPLETHDKEGAATQVSNSSNEEECCKTPTSSDHKIPTTQSCPPTPRKKVQVFSHHRKRKKPDHQFHFFEATGREEVDSFFRSTSSEMFESHAVNKRCKSL